MAVDSQAQRNKNVGGIPTPQRFSEDCMPSDQSENRTVLRECPAANWGFGQLFLVLADTFSLVAPMDTSFFVLE